jgi:hypothetical protein
MDKPMKMEQWIRAIAVALVLTSTDWSISITATGFSLPPLYESISCSMPLQNGV